MQLGIKSAIVLKTILIVKPLESEKYLRTKLKSYRSKVGTIFHNGKVPKESSHCICLSMILSDSVLRNDGKFVECK